MGQMEIVQIGELDIHPEALRTPKMTSVQLDALYKSIDVSGQLDPVWVYRNRIVDGRHRYICLNRLGIETIKVIRMPNNSTLSDIRDVVLGKEIRRHQTPTQLAISAYDLMKEKGMTQADSAKMIGATRKGIGLVKQIVELYGRRDIIDLLKNGDKFPHKEFSTTESLLTIVGWLSENSDVKGSKELTIPIDRELSGDEQMFVNKTCSVLEKESKIVLKAIVDRLYGGM